jgi:hypothetical protein
MAAVADPGLVAVFDVDPGDAEHGREPFVVMELCTGGSLADRLGLDRPMPPDDLVPILVAVSTALAALHRAGLVHRDIKPSNILFTAERAKLGDFGLVRSGTVGEATDLTEPGSAIGTLGYLAPERLRGDPGGPAADIYALGTVAYLGLTGRMPRPSGSVRDVVAAATLRPPAISTAAPSLGREFDDVVFAALAVDPARRPDALELGSGLGAALGRWTRSGRPGAVGAFGSAATAGQPRQPASAEVADAPESADDVAVAGVPRRTTTGIDKSNATDDPTTAIAIPLDATAAVGVPQPVAGPTLAPLNSGSRAEAPGPDVRRPRRPADRRRPAAGWLLPLAALALVVGLFLAARSLFDTSPAKAPATASQAASEAASPVPSASASVIASASLTPIASPTPPPTADPAVRALDAVDAAIAAARGGPDGLKGKEANDLENLASRVRRDLANGDRTIALKDARALDRRARDLADHIGEQAAARLTQATGDLVDALGG